MLAQAQKLIKEEKTWADLAFSAKVKAEIERRTVKYRCIMVQSWRAEQPFHLQVEMVLSSIREEFKLIQRAQCFGPVSVLFKTELAIKHLIRPYKTDPRHHPTWAEEHYYYYIHCTVCNIMRLLIEDIVSARHLCCLSSHNGGPQTDSNFTQCAYISK